MRKFYRYVTETINTYSKVFGNVEVIHPERLNDIDGCLIAPNHIRASDPPIIGSIFRKEMHALAKKELFDHFPLKNLLRYLGSIPIRRGQIDRKAINLAKEALTNGSALLMFPEGTRKSSSAKPGIGKIAYETQSNIVPVFIQYPESWFKSFIRKDSMKIVLGEKILISEYEKFDNRKEAYRFIAKDILVKILELENEC